MLLFKNKKLTKSIMLISGVLVAMVAMAAISFSLPDKLSENSLANKTKLVRMGSGWLVSTYGDATGPEVYDTKADDVRAARDIFVRVCHPALNESQCSSADDWSAPLNISNTANETSIATKWREIIGDDGVPVLGDAEAFYGDSEKPNIFVAGNFAVVTWVGKYCPGDQQRMISYTAREGLSVPFSCLYTSYTNNVSGFTKNDDGSTSWNEPVWNTQQITDGSRDAKSDFNKGLSIDGIGKWVFSWQEDPHGLQLGGGEGPGEGASGATVTHGTDVWYTYTEDLLLKPLATPVRISDNYTNDGAGGNTSPIYHPDLVDELTGSLIEIVELERGNTGASRPNLMLVGGSTPPTAVIAYEESKGADRLDSGKFVRYHEFAYNNPPVPDPDNTTIIDIQYANGEPGCIISDPLENSRRVRFVAQPTASFPNGLRMGVFWRQGLPTEGGPADIMVRVGKNTGVEGSTGLRPEDMEPAVDAANCRTSVYLDARELNNIPANNISSNTIPWSPVSCDAPVPTVPSNVLADTSSFNPYEDSKAHRAAIVGEDFYIGYSYAKDWAVATVIDLDNYNFWMRRYNAEGSTVEGTYDQGWTVAKNLSNITDVKTHVKEPRLVKTPGTNAADCADGYLENCQNKSALIVAWGTESNVYGHMGGSEEFDVYYTRTKDKGLTFEDPIVVPLIGYNNRFESQLRPSPAGNIIWTVWNEAENELDVDGEPVNIGTNAMLSVSDESVGTAPEPDPGDETPPLPPGPEDPPLSYDLAISLAAPEDIDTGETKVVAVMVTNIGESDLSSSATVTVTGITNRGTEYEPYIKSLSVLDVGDDEVMTFSFTTPDDKSTKIYWTSTVTVVLPDEDTNLTNNTATATTKIRK